MSFERKLFLQYSLTHCKSTIDNMINEIRIKLYDGGDSFDLMSPLLINWILQKK